MAEHRWHIRDERDALQATFNEADPSMDFASLVWGASTVLLRLREYADCDPSDSPDAQGASDV